MRRSGVLQTVSGLRLVDTFLKRTYEHDELAQVIVFDNDDVGTHRKQQQYGTSTACPVIS